MVVRLPAGDEMTIRAKSTDSACVYTPAPQSPNMRRFCLVCLSLFGCLVRARNADVGVASLTSPENKLELDDGAPSGVGSMPEGRTLPGGDPEALPNYVPTPGRLRPAWPESRKDSNLFMRPRADEARPKDRISLDTDSRVLRSLKLVPAMTPSTTPASMPSNPPNPAPTLTTSDRRLGSSREKEATALPTGTVFTNSPTVPWIDDDETPASTATPKSALTVGTLFTYEGTSDAPTGSPATMSEYFTLTPMSTAPSSVPTGSPTESTSVPTGSPTDSSSVPTDPPTESTSVPTGSPTDSSSVPTVSPTESTSVPTGSPTDNPSVPIGSPTATDSSDDVRAQVSSSLLAGRGTSSEVESWGTIAAIILSALAVIGILALSGGSAVTTRGEGVGGNTFGNGRRLAPPVPHGVIATPSVRSVDSDRKDRVSTRMPSETLGFILTMQLQFLAALSLVRIKADDSTLIDFATSLRWVNLWWSPSYSTGGFAECWGKGPITAQMYFGNTTLVLGIFVFICFLHIIVLSGVEASWLLRQRAKAVPTTICRHSAPATVLRTRFRNGRVVRRTSPQLESEDDDDPHDSQHTNLRSIPESGIDEEDGGQDVAAAPGTIELDPVAMCREQSSSAWLYFPHLELEFLLFVFHGAVASQAAAAESAASCPWRLYPVVIVSVLFQVLLLAMICRVIHVRVRPSSLLVFEPYVDDDGRTAPNSPGSLFSSLRTSWSDSGSVFSWADKGRWMTADVPDVQARRTGDRFRIGFEPTFVDFTISGVWFVVLFFVQSAVMACVGVLVDNGVAQLSLFCGLQATIFVIFVWLKPFANSVVNTIGTILAAVNVVTLILLAISESLQSSWDGEHVFVTTLQLLAICMLLIPIYLDLSNIATRAMGKMRRRAIPEPRDGPVDVTGEKPEDGKFVRHFTRRHWFGTWCTMLRLNFVAFIQDVREGFRRPNLPTSTRTGPDPPANRGADSDEDGVFRPPTSNKIATVDRYMPRRVQSDRSLALGSSSSHSLSFGSLLRRMSSHGGDLIVASPSRRLDAVEIDSSFKEFKPQKRYGSVHGLQHPLARRSAVFDHGSHLSEREDSLTNSPALVPANGNRQADFPGITPAPRRTIRNEATDSTRDVSFNIHSAVEGGSSGKEIIQQGRNKSDHGVEAPSDGRPAVSGCGSPPFQNDDIFPNSLASVPGNEVPGNTSRDVGPGEEDVPRIRVWGGTPAPPRTRSLSAVDSIKGVSFSSFGVSGSKPSGKGVIQQGRNRSDNTVGHSSDGRPAVCDFGSPLSRKDGSSPSSALPVPENPSRDDGSGGVNMSRRRAWGSTPALPRATPMQAEDPISDTTFNVHNASGGESSSKVLIQQGRDKSVELLTTGGLIWSSSKSSALMPENASREGAGSPKTDPSRAWAPVSNEAIKDPSFNRFTAAEGESSSKNIIQQGRNSSGRTVESLPSDPTLVSKESGRVATESDSPRTKFKSLKNPRSSVSVSSEENISSPMLVVCDVGRAQRHLFYVSSNESTSTVGNASERTRTSDKAKGEACSSHTACTRNIIASSAPAEEYSVKRSLSRSTCMDSDAASKYSSVHSLETNDSAAALDGTVARTVQLSALEERRGFGSFNREPTAIDLPRRRPTILKVDSDLTGVFDASARESDPAHTDDDVVEVDRGPSEVGGGRRFPSIGRNPTPISGPRRRSSYSATGNVPVTLANNTEDTGTARGAAEMKSASGDMSEPQQRYGADQEGKRFADIPASWLKVPCHDDHPRRRLLQANEGKCYLNLPDSPSNRRPDSACQDKDGSHKVVEDDHNSTRRSPAPSHDHGVAWRKSNFLVHKKREPIESDIPRRRLSEFSTRDLPDWNGRDGGDKVNRQKVEGDEGRSLRLSADRSGVSGSLARRRAPSDEGHTHTRHMRFNDDNEVTGSGSIPSKADAALGRSLSRQKGGALDVGVRGRSFEKILQRFHGENFSDSVLGGVFKSRERAVEWDQPCRRHRSSEPRAVEGRIAEERGQNAGGRGENGAHGYDLENSDDLDPPDADIAENSDLSEPDLDSEEEGKIDAW